MAPQKARISSSITYMVHAWLRGFLLTPSGGYQLRQVFIVYIYWAFNWAEDQYTSVAETC